MPGESVLGGLVPGESVLGALVPGESVLGALVLAGPVLAGPLETVSHWPDPAWDEVPAPLAAGDDAECEAAGLFATAPGPKPSDPASAIAVITAAPPTASSLGVDGPPPGDDSDEDISTS